MKSFLGRQEVILIGLIIFGYAEAWGADWKVYGTPESDIGVFYYDAGSITHPSKNIVRVSTKTIFSKKGVAERVEEFGEGYRNLSHAVFLREVNCVEKKSRVLRLTWYDKDGHVLASFQDKSKGAKWSIINPDSITEVLYQAVCK